MLCFLAVQHARSANPPPIADRLNGTANDQPTRPSTVSVAGGPPTLTTKDYLAGQYYPNRLNGTWLSATELLYRDDVGNVVTYDAATQKSTVLVDGNVGDLLAAAEYSLSADRRYLLIAKNVQRIFRHSSFAHYDAIEVTTGTVHPIAVNASAVDFLQLVQWSPVGNALVFVHGNNIFYQASVLAAAVAVTSDGSRSVGYGTCDWVYEEEIFASKTALWFAPDGQRLAFVRFDDSLVPVMSIPVYGEPGRPDSQYPQSIGLHYPKVGAPNPLVQLFTVELHALIRSGVAERHEQPVPADLRGADHVIAAVGWQSNETFVAAWMNRVQNRALIQECRAAECRVFKALSSATGWLDLFKPLQFSADGTRMLYIGTHEQADNAGGYRHVALVSTSNGSETARTAGQFEVTGILHWDEPSDRIFYTANTRERPEVQHVYAVRASGAVSAPDCLTCGLRVNGVPQTFFAAEFSSGHFAAISSEGPDIPEVAMYEWSVVPAAASVKNSSESVRLRRLAVIDSNAELHATVRNIAMPHISYMDVPLDNGNFTARVRVMVPANVDRSGRTKYAMLVNVYAGPDSFNGNDRFELGWSSVLVSNRSIVHVQINGRGSGLRGDRLRHTIYRKFGQVEVEDQIEVAQ